MSDRITHEAIEFNGAVIGYLVDGESPVPELKWIAEPVDYPNTRVRLHTRTRESAVAWLMEQHAKEQV